MASWLELDRRAFLDQWYSTQYAPSTYTGAAGQVQRWMHTSLERGYSDTTSFPVCLELGANIGEHFKFIKHSYSTYILSDISERVGDAIHSDAGVVRIQASAENIPLNDDSCDRVLHACLLHHVAEPESVLGEVRRVLKPGGIADLFLPCDPGMLFRLSRWIGPARSSRKQGLGDIKRLVDARDHRNHVGSLQRLIAHHFRGDRIERRSYPLRGLTWNSALWFTYRITKVS